MKQPFWHKLFEAGVALKAFNSVWETLAGILLLTKAHVWFTHILVGASHATFLGDEHPLVAHLLNGSVEHLATNSTRIFIGAYFLFHGIINAFLSYYLFRNRLWAYPVAILLSALFLAYQIARLTQTHSLTLLIVSVSDIAFIYLIWHEYRYQRSLKH